MTFLWTLLANPLGRLLVAGLGALVGSVLIYQVAYWKGYFDGRAAYKVKIEREIQNATKAGNDAAARALREFDASPDSLPDDGFRRD